MKIILGVVGTLRKEIFHSCFVLFFCFVQHGLIAFCCISSQILSEKESIFKAAILEEGNTRMIFLGEINFIFCKYIFDSLSPPTKPP